MLNTKSLENKLTNKVLFLDRDGVINIDKGHVHKINDFEFIDGIFDLCRSYHDKGYLIIIVTNQAGIAKKMYSEEQFLKLTDWMINEFSKKGIIISKVYYCPHHPSVSDCNCRKPKPGMIIKAIEEFQVDIDKSVLIGDKDSDLEAGKKAGIKKLIKI